MALIFRIVEPGDCGGQKCHMYASCFVDRDTGKESCGCRLGFVGDGLNCKGYYLFCCSSLMNYLFISVGNPKTQKMIFCKVFLLKINDYSCWENLIQQGCNRARAVFSLYFTIAV